VDCEHFCSVIANVYHHRLLQSVWYHIVSLLSDITVLLCGTISSHCCLSSRFYCLVPNRLTAV